MSTHVRRTGASEACEADHRSILSKPAPSILSRSPPEATVSKHATNVASRYKPASFDALLHCVSQLLRMPGQTALNAYSTRVVNL
jgi:hypothetical protein